MPKANLTILQRVPLPRKFLRFAGILLMLAPGLINHARATHLMGGSMTYVYLGEAGNGISRYELIVDMYRDCSIPPTQSQATPFDPSIEIGIYERKGPDSALVQNITMTLGSDNDITPPLPSTNCPRKGSADSICVHEGLYRTEIDLSPSQYGYYIVFTRCCRNTMANVQDNAGQTYFAIIPPTNIHNNSPQFTSAATPMVCVHDTMSLSYAAIDPDNDSLVYSLAWPYSGSNANMSNPDPGPNTNFTGIDLVQYNSGYSPTFPLGAKGFAYINSVTGVLTLYAPLVGRYALAVDVKEYRNGQLIAVTRRDIQVISADICDNHTPPKRVAISDSLTSDKSTVTSYTIEAGTRIAFNMRYQANNPPSNTNIANIVSVTYTGFMDNPGGFTHKPYLSSVDYDNTAHTATLYFSWQTSCADANTIPYTFTVTATDDGCPALTTYQGFAIYVVPFQGASKIIGPNPACAGKPGNIYHTGPQKKGYELTWDVNGGAYTNGPNDSSITVIWGNSTTGQIKIVGKNSVTGCKGDSVIKTITINPKPALPVISGPAFACLKDKSVYNISSNATETYSWAPANGTISSISSSTRTIQVTWARADTNQVFAVGKDSNGCATDSARSQTVVENPIADSIFGAYSVCPNASDIDYWVKAQAGSTYYWIVTGGIQAAGGNTSHIKIDWGNKGGGTIKVIEKTAHGCMGDTVHLNVLKDYVLYTSPIQGDTSICEFSAASPYSVTFSNGSTYDWKISGGTIIAGQGTAGILVNWDKAGTGVLMVTESAYDGVNNKPCVGIPVSLIIHIHQKPNTSEIIGPAGICEGDIVIYSVNGLAGSTYIWQFNGKKSVYTTDTARFQETGLTTITDTVNVQVTEVSKDGCFGPTRQLTVTVHKLPVTTDITGPALICFPNLDSAVYQVTGFPTSVYNWTVDGGAILSGDKTQQITVNWYKEGNRSVHVQEVSDFGCTGPLKDLNVKVDSLALDMDLVTTAESDDKEIDVFWSVKNPDFFNGYYRIFRSAQGQEFFRLIDSVPATQSYYVDKNVNTAQYAYRYKVVAVNSCGFAISTSIHRSILLTGAFDGDTTIKVNWNAYEGWPVDNYNINSSQNDDTSYALYNFTKDTSYMVIKTLEGYRLCLRIAAYEAGTTHNIISWSNKVCIDFDPILWIPNAYTPNNGDNLNNTFHIFVANYKTFIATIYNRWGERIFTTDDPNKQWDGTYKGATCTEGVYLYQVTVGGAKTNIYRSGTVSLMR